MRVCEGGERLVRIDGFDLDPWLALRLRKFLTAQDCEMVTQTFASWNRVIDCLTRIDRLQRVAQSILSPQTSLVPERLNGIEPHRPPNRHTARR